MTVKESKAVGKLTRRGIKLNKENPFLPATSANTTTKNRKICNSRGDMMLFNSQEGEIIAPVAGFWYNKTVDDTKFVKLYVGGVKAFTDLSNAGTRVFEVLYRAVQTQIGTDQVYLSFSIVDQEITPMSETTYTRGMRELISKDFIAASIHTGLFFINPDYLFNGNRLTFVQSYIKKSSAASANPIYGDDQLALPINNSI